jgi:hypothetical protein
MARAAHEEFVQQQLKSGDSALATLRNPALQPWERLEARYREFSCRWVDQVSVVIKGLGYTITPLTDWDESSKEVLPGDAQSLARLTQEILPDGEKATGYLQVDDVPAFLGRAGFQASHPLSSITTASKKQENKKL